MPHTLAELIIGHAAGHEVKAGDLVVVNVGCNSLDLWLVISGWFDRLASQSVILFGRRFSRSHCCPLR